jgi:hypothetical protein
MAILSPAVPCPDASLACYPQARTFPTQPPPTASREPFPHSITNIEISQNCTRVDSQSILTSNVHPHRPGPRGCIGCCKCAIGFGGCCWPPCCKCGGRLPYICCLFASPPASGPPEISPIPLLCIPCIPPGPLAFIGIGAAALVYMAGPPRPGWAYGLVCM